MTVWGVLLRGETPKHFIIEWEAPHSLYWFILNIYINMLYWSASSLKWIVKEIFHTSSSIDRNMTMLFHINVFDIFQHFVKHSHQQSLRLHSNLERFIAIPSSPHTLPTKIWSSWLLTQTEKTVIVWDGDSVRLIITVQNQDHHPLRLFLGLVRIHFCFCSNPLLPPLQLRLMQTYSEECTTSNPKWQVPTSVWEGCNHPT